jgi:hypothetical protein
MKDTLDTVDEVLDALGGNAQVARLLGETPQTVGNWRLATRRRIPAVHFMNIASLLEERGLYAHSSVFGMKEPVLDLPPF